MRHNLLHRNNWSKLSLSNIFSKKIMQKLRYIPSCSAAFLRNSMIFSSPILYEHACERSRYEFLCSPWMTIHPSYLSGHFHVAQHIRSDDVVRHCGVISQELFSFLEWPTLKTRIILEKVHYFYIHKWLLTQKHWVQCLQPIERLGKIQKCIDQTWIRVEIARYQRKACKHTQLLTMLCDLCTVPSFLPNIRRTTPSPRYTGWLSQTPVQPPVCSIELENLLKCMP